MVNLHTTLLKCLANFCTIVMLSSCGPAFSVKNDTTGDIYIDTIYESNVRNLSLQTLPRGQIYTAPRCWNEIRDLYIGYQRDHVKRQDFRSFCSLSHCDCAISMSQIDKADRSSEPIGTAR